MNAIEAAIQAATNAGTAHGFAQALDNMCKNLETSVASLSLTIENNDAPAEMRDIAVHRRDTLVEVLAQVVPQRDASKAQAEQLQKLATATAAAALQVPDMAKIRGAVAVLMGAG
jgi:hypothetical protein